MTIADFISLFYGIALFLFGMTLMGDGLKKVSGNRLEPILFKLSGTPWRGMLLGTGVTAVIQSSSATSVMVVGFVNSGLMKVQQAISVTLGAILGTSVTGWIVCLSELDTAGIASLFSATTLAGVIAVAGILLRMFGKKRSQHNIGDIMLGFSILMMGMHTMSDSVRVLGDQPWFTEMLSTMTNPMAGILVGIVFSAILQSASAAVGIVQALSATGAISFASALPLLMGISIGASLPVLLSALGASTDGKRTALGYLVATTAGVMALASLFYITVAIIPIPLMTMTMDAFSIALVNTIMRLCMLCILAPFTDVLEAMVSMMIPEKKEEQDMMMHLEERFLSHPALAMEQVRRTVCDMAQKTETAVKLSEQLLFAYTDAGYDQVERLEKAGDRYEDGLGSYLMQLTAQDLSKHQSDAVAGYLQSLSDFERLSDHALAIARSAREVHEKHISFSPKAIEELRVVTGVVGETVGLTMQAFIHADQIQAGRVEPLQYVIDDLCEEMKVRHVERLRSGTCTIELGFVLNDLITNFQRLSAHCSNIAIAIYEVEQGSVEAHTYQAKEKRSPHFERYLSESQEKFSLPA